jgi:hypothetical protein
MAAREDNWEPSGKINVTLQAGDHFRNGFSDGLATMIGRPETIVRKPPVFLAN